MYRLDIAKMKEIAGFIDWMGKYEVTDSDLRNVETVLNALKNKEIPDLSYEEIGKAVVTRIRISMFIKETLWEQRKALRKQKDFLKNN